MIVTDGARFFLALVLVGLFFTLFRCEVAGEPLYDPNLAIKSEDIQQIKEQKHAEGKWKTVR